MPQPVPCVFFFDLSILPASFLFDIFIISFYLSFKYPTCPEFSFSFLCSCPTPYFHSPSEVWFYYICLSSHFLDRSSWIKISSLFPLHQKKQEPPSAPASHLLYSVFMTDFPGTGRFRIRGSLRRSAGGRKVLRQSRNRVQMLCSLYSV